MFWQTEHLPISQDRSPETRVSIYLLGANKTEHSFTDGMKWHGSVNCCGKISVLHVIWQGLSIIWFRVHYNCYTQLYQTWLFTKNIKTQQVLNARLLFRKLHSFNLILFVPEYTCSEQFCSGQDGHWIPRSLKTPQVKKITKQMPKITKNKKEVILCKFYKNGRCNKTMTIKECNSLSAAKKYIKTFVKTLPIWSDLLKTFPIGTFSKFFKFLIHKSL